MNKWHFLLFSVFFLVGDASALTVFERSFAEMGYADFVLDGSRVRACTEMLFVFPADINLLSQENYAIASLHLVLLPLKGKNFFVEIKLNDENLGVFGSESILCERQCWLRVQMPKSLLGWSENSLKVCLNNPVDVAKSVLAADSLVGVYRTVDFSRKGSFEEKAEKNEVVLGEKVKITLILHNYGSAAGFVEMKHARDLAKHKEAFVVVDGNTHFRGFIKPRETIKVSYVIRPRVIGTISLPPAVLYYTNEFSERKQLFAGMVSIHVREPERKANAFIIKQQEINRVGALSKLRVAVKNEGKDALFNLVVRLSTPPELAINGETEFTISTLPPQETKYFDFSVKALKAGKYRVGCSILYPDLNEMESKCKEAALVFEEREVPIELLAGLVLLGVGVVAYLFIHIQGSK